jgi:DNA-directed RNA polymerase
MSREPSAERLHARHLPMLVRPKPWVSHDQGGYLINKSEFYFSFAEMGLEEVSLIELILTASAMRYKDSHEQKIYMQEASNSGNLELVYSGLDVLGATPWRVNRAIFDVVLEVWNSGMSRSLLLTFFGNLCGSQ